MRAAAGSNKTQFLNTLARTTVTIHEHLDETVWIGFGPHVGLCRSDGEKLSGARTEERRGKVEISQKQRDFHFPKGGALGMRLI